MAVCQNLVPLVNPKIAGKWMFIPPKMVSIGIDPYPYLKTLVSPHVLRCHWHQLKPASKSFSTTRRAWNGKATLFSFPKGGAGQQKKELQFIICAHFHIYLILFIIFYNTILLGCQWMSLLVSVWYHFPVGRKRVVSLFVSTSEGEVGRVKRANLPSLVGFKHY